MASIRVFTPGGKPVFPTNEGMEAPVADPPISIRIGAISVASHKDCTKLPFGTNKVDVEVPKESSGIKLS